MGKVIATIIIILIVLFGGYYLVQNRNSRNASNPPRINNPAQNVLPGQNVVTYSEAGFSPKEITIKVGNTVTWINQESTGKMWIASAPHPTHTDYPGFDAKREIPPGESYSFTFEKIGDWKYHNHLDPTENGIVHVTQ